MNILKLGMSYTIMHDGFFNLFSDFGCTGSPSCAAFLQVQ